LFKIGLLHIKVINFIGHNVINYRTIIVKNGETETSVSEILLLFWRKIRKKLFKLMNEQLCKIEEKYGKEVINWQKN
jgi:hypothetical protein